MASLSGPFTNNFFFEVIAVVCYAYLCFYGFISKKYVIILHCSLNSSPVW